MTNEKFEFTDSLKKNLYIMMGLGLLGLVWVFLGDHESNHHGRLWSNLLANSYYFTGIALFGMFVVSATQLAYGGWQTLMKRIFISMSAFARIGGFLLLLILVAGIADVHKLYDHVAHIMHTGHGEPKYSTKLVYFASWFWIGRVFIYALLWATFSIVFDRFFGDANQSDQSKYKKSKLLAAAFIVVFAVTESAVSWDMIMSIDPHWFSTLFGWYNFASYGCAAWATSILIIIYLKSKGYLNQVNENHVHDLGKMLFGFSIFWTYLWFSQFMLQWYANIPEDTNFWVKRFDEPYFKVTIFGALIVNFLFPLFFLIKRSAKRNFKMIGFGAALLIFGHYVDFFNYTFVEPNWNQQAMEHGHGAALKSDKVVMLAEATHATESAHATTDAVKHEGHEAAAAVEVKHGEHGEHGAKAGHGHEAPVKNFAAIGIGEILVFIGFGGLFLFMFFSNLSKRNIVPEDDPYLKESEKLNVTWA
jgi:hypothetical protein